MTDEDMSNAGGPGDEESEELGIAVVGMAGRWASARDVGEFWRNLLAGHESAKPVSEEDFLAAGGSRSDLGDPTLVRMASVIDDIGLFDAEFFGYSPAEAKLMDPQQRLFLETCQHALEHAGYDPARSGGEIGVYGGSSQSEYFLSHVHPRYAHEPGSLTMLAAKSANMVDAFATRVSFELGLTGPSMSVQTACSSSLVAVHLACQDLLNYRCDTALAGGAALNPSAHRGYRYVEQGVLSPDGRTRAFDAEARGTIRGDGVAAVVLRRLEDALADGDRVWAVVKGSAINNDGRRKPGYTAPSPDGQTAAILGAHFAAEVSADTISYVEAHGTGTPVGDPIEVDALTRAFRESTDRTGFCALGSVKSNVGHTDAAAGVTGLIKVILAMRHRTLPPTVGFTRPNPSIDFEPTPFRVFGEVRPWRPAEGAPLRAGVSSFGVGGTNAHVIVEEPPQRRAAGEEGGGAHLLRVSARTPSQLATACRQLADHLEAHPGLGLGDVAHTLDVGRRRFAYRRAVAARTVAEAVGQLRTAAGEPAGAPAQVGRRVAFLLPGGGAQYPEMGAELYRTEPVFREEMDRASAALRPRLGHHLTDELYAGLEPAAPALLASLVAVEHALARLVASHGVTPSAMLGHSLGEYTAACLAGVMSLEDALVLVHERDRLLHRKGGATLGVWLPEEELAPYLEGTEVDLATVNSRTSCTVSGSESAVAALEERLSAAGVALSRVRLRIAPHSRHLDAVLPEFAELVGRVELSVPRIPYISNVTGTWITPDQATDPAYWVRHMRETVRFADGLAELARSGNIALTEVGPGRGLTRHAQAQLGAGTPVVPMMRHARETRSDVTHLLDSLGRLWAAGSEREPDTDRLSAQRVPLPGYPFERTRHWIERVTPQTAASAPAQEAPLPYEPNAGAAEIRAGEASHAAPSGTGHASVAPYPQTVAEDAAVGHARSAGSGPAHGGTGADGRTERSSAFPAFNRRPALDCPYAAPRTSLERDLVQHWQEVLGLEGIGVEDNFFDLGGDSLLALQLASRVRSALGRTFTVAALVEHPTVADLAARLDGARGDSGTALDVVLELRSGGSGTPLFCVHPAGGVAWPYARLLPALDDRFPVYGIQSRGLTDPGAVPRTIEEMAADYVQEIRAVQTSGPYALMGWSLGGFVAHAVAGQLEGAGERVALLATLDAFPFTADDALKLPDAEEVDAFLMQVLLTDAGIVVGPDGPGPDLAEVVSRLRGSDSVLAGIEEESLGRIADVMLRNTQSLFSYTPGTVSCDLLAFTATESHDASAPAPVSRWKPYVGGAVEGVDLPCDHYGVLRGDALGIVGAVLRERLIRLDRPAVTRVRAL
ncbi:alpha/beta fold hydrolase [Streptomyces sp. MUM 136J]|uniref:type I polyketide synthase n=1 Tax=Streptomyces sp. MUM 136J TaxID=2791992 RepID=UPI0023D96425|nr:alpha/beta fold hydrolase [Streptomyces sp. MUM 136J]MCH0568879.1 alpha/beta fold hydrolase [Streptomyces sp. MUM 136J]